MPSREPLRPPVRLTAVKRLAVSLVALLSVQAVPVLGQEGGLTVEAVAGLGGYVDPSRPVEVLVTVTADVLFSGEIQVRSQQGAATIGVPAEVPAGTTKTYRVVIPPPVGSGSARIQLVPDGGDAAVASANVGMHVSEGEVLIGVHGDPELLAALSSVRTEIAGVPVRPIPVDDPQRDLSPLPYLVTSAEAVPDSVLRWVERGGRLLVPADRAWQLADGLEELGNFPRTDAAWFGSGRGEILGVPDLSAESPWPILLRPVAAEPAARDFWQTPERALGAAAAGGGEQRVPALPWLLGAIVAYAVLVGPINFLVLRRLRRRDLAWFTVPVLSLAAVGAFWAAGQTRLQGVVLNHATLLVGGPQEPTARSALVLATGAPGTHAVAFDDGWLVYPGRIGEAVDQFGRPIAAATGDVDGSTITYELPQLGVGGAQTIYLPPELPSVSMAPDAERPVVSVTNPTELDFWAWGVGGVGQIRVGPGSLAPGQTGTVAAPGGRAPEMGGNIGDAVVQARQLWNDETSWQVLYPLGEAAGFLAGDLSVPYFFGYTKDYKIPVTVDGAPREVDGSTLVVVPLDTSDELLVRLGRARASLLSTGRAGFIDRGPGWLFVSTDEMTVSFDLPGGVAVDPLIDFVDGFGERPQAFEVWDWTMGRFEAVEEGAPLDRARFMAATGDVLVKALARSGVADQEVFVEIPMSPSSFVLRWDTA